MTWRVTYARVGECAHQVGSDFDDFERASAFFTYSVKHDDWRGTVRLEDSEGKTIKSVTSGTEGP